MLYQHGPVVLVRKLVQLLYLQINELRQQGTTALPQHLMLKVIALTGVRALKVSSH
jgi:hypothetical protein